MIPLASRLGSTVIRPSGVMSAKFGFTALALALLLGSVFKVPAQTTPDDLKTVLDPLREKYGLPGLAAAAMIKTRLVALGATGVRKLGSPERVTIDDQWQIGSCTKSMTATVAAMLVERGEMRWTSTVGEISPSCTARWNRSGPA